MSALKEASAKKSISLRVPSSVLEDVDAYAESESLSRTEAFLYFVVRGLEDEQNKNDVTMKDLMGKLNSIEAFLLDPSAVASSGVLSLENITMATSKAASLFPDISKVWLFGSYAQGTATKESDIDLRIELNSDATFSLYDLARFTKQIERLTHKEVDVVSARKIKNKNLAQAIEKEKVLIYER